MVWNDNYGKEEIHIGGSCMEVHCDKVILDGICYQGNNKLLLAFKKYKKGNLSEIFFFNNHNWNKNMGIVNEVRH